MKPSKPPLNMSRRDDGIKAVDKQLVDVLTKMLLGEFDIDVAHDSAALADVNKARTLIEETLYLYHIFEGGLSCTTPTTKRI